MQAPDVRPDDAPADDELADAAFDRELAQRLEEELRADEGPLEDDIEERVVAASEPVVTHSESEEAAPLLEVLASLEEPLSTKTDENVLRRDEEEFVCRSCCLVKRRTQLADPRRLLCIDCTRT
jgi:hypothetical protein